MTAAAAASLPTFVPGDTGSAATLAPFDHRGTSKAELRTLLESGRPSLQRVKCVEIGQAMDFGRGTAYAYPSSVDIHFLRQHARRLVECGSGSGLYASTLRRNGFDVIATDPRLDADDTGRSKHYFFTFGTYSPMALMDGATAVDAHLDRDVLIMAPDPEQDWPADAIRRVVQRGRRVFIAPDCPDFMAQPGIKRHGLLGIPSVELALADGFRPLGKSMLGFGQIFGFERL